MTTTTLSHITVLGPVTEGALYFKEGGGSFTITDFYTDSIDLGVKVKDTDAAAAARIENGDLIISAMQFDNPSTDFEITDYTGLNQTFVIEGMTLGAGNGAGAPSWSNGWSRGL